MLLYSFLDSSADLNVFCNCSSFTVLLYSFLDFSADLDVFCNWFGQ